MEFLQPKSFVHFTSWVCGLAVLFILLTGSAFATSTADHSKFKELQNSFDSGPEVTKACIKCHTEAAKQIHKTKHWTWEFLNPDINSVSVNEIF